MIKLCGVKHVKPDPENRNKWKTCVCGWHGKHHHGAKRKTLELIRERNDRRRHKNEWWVLEVADVAQRSYDHRHPLKWYNDNELKDYFNVSYDADNSLGGQT